MISIKSIGTALPEHSYSNADIHAVGNVWLGGDQSSRDLFQHFVQSTKVRKRFFALPVEEVIKLNGLAARAGYFEELGPPLGARAVSAALHLAEVGPSAVAAFIFTSCSCPLIPSIDAMILQQLNFSPLVQRVPIYQHGCAGGVAGLSLACRLAQSAETVLVNSVELCSLVFQPRNHGAGHLVGAALFGDGASCAVVSADGGGKLSFLASQSHLIKDSRRIMGYDVLDDGFHLRLDRLLPEILTKAVPQIVAEFLRRHDVLERDIKWWLFHPGGIKILSFLERTFELEPWQCSFAHEVLQETGNLSSSTILFVLEKFMRSPEPKHGDLALVLGIGPGLTVELLLLQVN